MGLIQQKSSGCCLNNSSSFFVLSSSSILPISRQQSDSLKLWVVARLLLHIQQGTVLAYEGVHIWSGILLMDDTTELQHSYGCSMDNRAWETGLEINMLYYSYWYLDAFYSWIGECDLGGCLD